MLRHKRLKEVCKQDTDPGSQKNLPLSQQQLSGKRIPSFLREAMIPLAGILKAAKAIPFSELLQPHTLNNTQVQRWETFSK